MRTGASSRNAGPWIKGATIAALLGLSILAIVPFAPDMPFWPQDSSWPFALNQATALHLVFGRDVIFNFGPWGAVYTGQYHPATDATMIAGDVLVALSFAGGLAVTARDGRLAAVLPAPLVIAAVALHDPVFMVLPLLLLIVSALSATSTERAAHVPVTPTVVAVVVLLAAADALLTFVKLTFGTEAMPMAVLSVVALSLGRRYRLAALLAVVYLGSLPLFWLLGGQRLADLPSYLASVPTVLGGYSEGAAKSGPLAAPLCFAFATFCLLAMLWRDRDRLAPATRVIIGLGTCATLFLVLKAGFVRDDEHAFIALGALALLPFALANALRPASLALAIGVAAFALIVPAVADRYAGLTRSLAHCPDRLAASAAGLIERVRDPGRLAHVYAADLAVHRAAFPLPRFMRPTDIYSSGQTILIASGSDWSPRPALQSFTAFSAAVARADRDHLGDPDARGGPVRTVLFAIEDEDDRLPAFEDGLSWPVLLDQFRVARYDRRLDLAFLQRARPPRPVDPGPVLLDRTATIGHDVPVPVAPEGTLIWATIDVRPTLIGSLASFLLRPPTLSIDIDYNDGTSGRYRYVPALGRIGFLLTPRIDNTAEMLLLQLPERRRPSYRPTMIRIVGEHGTSLLWRHKYRLVLRSFALPTQPDIRAFLVDTPTPVPSDEVAPPMRVGSDDRCEIDVVADHVRPSGPVVVPPGLVRVAGWLVPARDAYGPPERVLLRFTAADGSAYQATVAPRWRPDISTIFGAAASDNSGFDDILDLSTLHGRVTVTLETMSHGKQRVCPARQTLMIQQPTASSTGVHP